MYPSVGETLRQQSVKDGIQCSWGVGALDLMAKPFLGSTSTQFGTIPVAVTTKRMPDNVVLQMGLTT